MTSPQMPAELLALGTQYDLIVAQVNEGRLNAEDAMQALARNRVVDHNGVTWTYNQSGQLTYYTTADGPPVLATADSWTTFAATPPAPPAPGFAQPAAGSTNPFGPATGTPDLLTPPHTPVHTPVQDNTPPWARNSTPTPTAPTPPPAPSFAAPTQPSPFTPAEPAVDADAPPWQRNPRQPSAPSPVTGFGQPTANRNPPPTASAADISAEVKSKLAIGGLLSHPFVKRNKYLLGVAAAGIVILFASFLLSDSTPTPTATDTTSSSEQQSPGPPAATVTAATDAYSLGDVPTITTLTAATVPADQVTATADTFKAAVTAGGTLTAGEAVLDDQSATQTWTLVDANSASTNYVVTWSNTSGEWLLTSVPAIKPAT